MHKKNDIKDFERAAESASQATGVRVRFDRHFAYNAHLGAGRFSLPNGLTIIVLPDSRAPVFTFQTWFRVGSADEDPELTGIAHLFEHLMFKGTEAYPDGVLDREIGMRGGDANGATSWDWTYYTQTLAARGDNLELVVALEADRMVNLVLDQDTFASELEVVKNERRMSVDDSVGGLLSEQLSARAFRKHPYRWSPLGSMEHLDRATLDDLKNFYRTYYAPNNAIVVVAGDVACSETLALIARKYGPLQGQDQPQHARPPEPRQERSQYIEFAKPVNTPLFIAGYHGAAQATVDFAALEIWNEILSTGDNGRLYRRLAIEEKLATGASGAIPATRDPCLFEIGVDTTGGVGVAQVLNVLQDELDRLPGSVTPHEIEKAANNLELAFYESLADTEQCAENLGHYETTCGDFSVAFRWLEWYPDITPETLDRVAREVFRESNRTVVAAVPESTK